MHLNYIDIIIVIIALAFTIRGGMRGFIAELMGLLGIAVGFFLAWKFYPVLSPELTRFIDPAAAPAAAVILLVIGGMLAVALVGRILRKLLEFSFASSIDHILGLLIGLAKGVILCTLGGYALYRFVPQLDLVRESQLLPWLQQIADAALAAF